MNRNLPTFADATIGAYAKDTRNGTVRAFLGAIIIGLAFGLLGGAGVTVAFLGLFLSLSGVASMVGPRPIDSSLFRPALALPMGFACPVVKVNAHLAPLNLGAPAAAYQRALRAQTGCREAMVRAMEKRDAWTLAKARWLGAWPETRVGLSDAGPWARSRN